MVPLKNGGLAGEPEDTIPLAGQNNTKKVYETEATSRATTKPPNGYRYPPSREDQEASDKVARSQRTRQNQEQGQ